MGYQQRSDHEAGALKDCLSAITGIGASEPRAGGIPHPQASRQGGVTSLLRQARISTGIPRSSWVEVIAVGDI